MNNLDILKIREKLNISQEELARKVGVSRRTVANWEAGRTIPEHQQRLLEMVSQNAEIDKSQNLAENEVKSTDEMIMVSKSVLDTITSQQQTIDRLTKILERQISDAKEPENQPEKSKKAEVVQAEAL